MIKFNSKTNPMMDNDYNTAIAEKHPLNPMLTTLSVLGIRVFHVPDGIKRILLRFHLIIVMFCYHYWALSDIVWYFRNNLEAEDLADSVTVWASVCSVDFLFLQRYKFRKILTVVYYETLKLSESDQNKFSRCVKIVCVLAWLYITLFIVQYLVFTLHVDFDENFSNTPLYFFHKYLSKNTINIIMKIDHCVEYFFIQGSFTMIITLYVLLCGNAHLWFKALKNRYASSKFNKNSILERHEVLSFRNDFDSLSKHVELIDEVFSRTVALWLLVILLILCVRIISILNPLTPTTDQMIVITCLALTRAAVTLICVSLSADKVSKEAALCLGQLDNLLRKSKTAWNSTVYHEVQLAFTKYFFFPTQLTVWKFAGLNRAFMMTCVGMMTTYVIICIQLNPNVMKSLAG